MRLGFIGTGTISTAVVHALAPKGHEIIVSERSATNAEALSQAYENVRIGTNAEVVAGADILFLGLMPEHVAQALIGLPFRAGQQMISFVADTPLSEVAALIAPAKVETLVLPFPAIAKTRSPLIAHPPSKLAEDIFSDHDVFSARTPAEFQALLRAQAVLSPVAQMLAEAATWAGEQGADAGNTEAFLRALVASNLSANALSPLLKSLSTEGGYNARLREHLEASGTYTALRDGLDKL